MTRGVMTLDRYVFSFLKKLFKRPFQINDCVHLWRLHLDLFLSNFNVCMIFVIMLNELLVSLPLQEVTLLCPMLR